MRDIKKNLAHRTLNLQNRRIVVMPITSFLKGFFVVGVVLLMFFLKPTARAPIGGSTYAAETDFRQQLAQVDTAEEVENTEARRKALEDQLQKLHEDIARQQQLIEQTRTQQQTLQSEIQRIQAEVRKLNLQLEAVNLSLSQLSQDIVSTQRNIDKTREQIDQHKEALTESVRSIQETDGQSTLAILLQNNKVSDFFNSLNNIMLVQDSLSAALNQVIELRHDLLTQKEQLGLEREDVENLKEIREQRKKQLEIAKNRQANLLAVSERKESEYEELLSETRKTAAEVRSQIFKLVGGGELTFETAYDLARLAESATGVRAALIMAILDRESRLGQNVGNCSYDNAMHPSRDIPVFLAITETLDINPKSTVAKVSCPITQHGAYGGAMGPSQFIPSTWAIYAGYEKKDGEWQYNSSKDRVRRATGGNDPSNPWNNTDAFVATALYIQDLYGSPTCSNYADGLAHKYPRQELQEECATARYYAGSRWRSYYSWYGIEVVARADEIQRDINILNS